MKLSKYLGISATVAIFIGCGGGGGNTPAKTGTGYYVDSAIVGANYKCGSQSGVTGEGGKFTFEQGVNCEFSLAGIPLKSVSKTELYNGKKIVEDDVNVAQLLQSLDADGNPDNGIQITKEIADAVKKAVADIKDPKKVISDDDIKEVVVDKVAEISHNSKIKLKTKSEVEKHLNKTKTQITKELFAGKTFYFVEKGKVKSVKVNKDATILTFDNKNIYHATIKGNTIIDEDGTTYIDKVTDKYIKIYRDRGGEGFTGKLYYSKADAEKAYENDKITADKVKKAFANKTIYRVRKYKDGTIKLAVVKTTDNQIDFKNYINNKLDKEDSGVIKYTIKGDSILVTGDKGTDSLKVMEITNSFILLSDSEDGDTETWYYSKTEAINHPEIRDHNYYN